ncbi:MAG: 4Fe-4S dicluster domain-containing protein [bacterium]|nr:4Fe-4S dicluster domain-containing protein [bacterium]
MKHMKKLALNCSEMTISDAPEPVEVLIPLKGLDDKRAKDKLKLKLKDGTPLNTGQPVAAGVLSTVTGTVKGLESLLLGSEAITAVRVEVSGEETIDPGIKKEPGYLGKTRLDLLERLNRAGLGFGNELETVKTVIVSAVDTDPLHTICHQILREKKETVSEGLELVKHLLSAEQVILVVPEPLYGLVSETAGDSVFVHKVNPVYPDCLPELLLDGLSQVYGLESHLFLGVEKLTAAVEALREGKPFVHKVVSVIDENGTRNKRVRLGTSIKELLKETYINDGDKVIVGGGFRGTACFNMDYPITGDMDSIYVQHSDKGEVSHDRNNPCMHCGKCVKVCPVNLDVNLLCRYSEFSLFGSCHEMGIEACIECGLCAYVCPSGRSLVQFIRLAKREKPAEEIEEVENGEKES